MLSAMLASRPRRLPRRCHLMAPPTQGTPVTFRCPRDDLAALDLIAERDNTTRAELLRQIIADYVKSQA